MQQFLLLLEMTKGLLILPKPQAWKPQRCRAQGEALRTWPRRPHLVQAARGAVLAAGGQVAELHVQQVDELHHGRHGVGDVAGVQVVPGVLRQLPRDVGCHLP